MPIGREYRADGCAGVDIRVFSVRTSDGPYRLLSASCISGQPGRIRDRAADSYSFPTRVKYLGVTWFETLRVSSSRKTPSSVRPRVTLAVSL
ncbi:hypothetical protein C446_06795 [Halobiforma nitratireducens JCM 10879]|uniref:Uncharacterized protein n=1 Tax=Halobiforma nitratireducens JCM 10879 TaxID=1227454 RepID=M0M8C3_9EURY|nr:hypothetical protein C446_06795 [Halobiforma nitratireducens JCM 10879]